MSSNPEDIYLLCAYQRWHFLDSLWVAIEQGMDRSQTNNEPLHPKVPKHAPTAHILALNSPPTSPDFSKGEYISWHSKQGVTHDMGETEIHCIPSSFPCCVFLVALHCVA